MAEAVRGDGAPPRGDHLGRPRRPARRRRPPLRPGHRSDPRAESGTAVEVLTPDFRGVPDALDVVLGGGARGLLPQHGDGPAPLPRGPARQPLRPQPRPARRGAAAARRGGVRRPGEDRHHGRAGRDARRGPRHAPGHPRRRASRSSPSASTSSPRRSTCRSTAGSIPTSSPPTGSYALSLGFAHCEAGPLVRSSYHAHEHVAAARVSRTGQRLWLGGLFTRRLGVSRSRFMPWSATSDLHPSRRASSKRSCWAASRQRESRGVILHLLPGCPQCQEVTAAFWDLGLGPGREPGRPLPLRPHPGAHLRPRPHARRPGWRPSAPRRAGSWPSLADPARGALGRTRPERRAASTPGGSASCC